MVLVGIVQAIRASITRRGIDVTALLTGARRTDSGDAFPRCQQHIGLMRHRSLIHERTAGVLVIPRQRQGDALPFRR
jgi:hypothetical protein